MKKQAGKRPKSACSGAKSRTPLDEELDAAIEKAEQGRLPPSPPPKHPGPLRTIGSVRKELARVYVDARMGEIDPSDAAKLAFMLQTLSKMIVDDDVEKRLSALEEHMDAKTGAAAWPDA